MALFDRMSEDNIDDTATLFCQIENSERIQNYTEYVIRVQRGPSSSNSDFWTVKHRYNDFVELNNELAPCGLPLPLPPKKLIGNSQREFIAKRSHELQVYLNVILSHPLLSMSVPVKKFLDPKRYSSDFRAGALQCLSVCLRSLYGWSISEPWQQASWRLRKHYFFVKHAERPKIKQVLAWSYYGSDWCLDSKDTLILLDFLGKLNHPYLWNPEFSWCNEDGGLVIRQYLSEGTLRDQMTKAKPSNYFLKKYCNPKTVFPLDSDDIRHIGRHILEALRFLHRIGYPFGQLHCGNLTITESGCQILDVEDAIFGLSSFYRQYFVQLKAVKNLEDTDVYCFGQAIYEMALGEPLNGPTLPVNGLSSDCPRILRGLLTSLLSEKSTSYKLPTVEELLQHELFRTVPCIQGPKEFRISARVTEILQRCKKQIERRLKQDQLDYRHAVKSKRVTAFFNSDEQKRERRKLMKQLTMDGLKVDTGLIPNGDPTPSAMNSPPVPSNGEIPPCPINSVVPAPPPPPPRIPPSFSTNSVPNGNRPNASNGDFDRAAVFDSIRGFSREKLKKTETKDRSGPKI